MATGWPTTGWHMGHNAINTILGTILLTASDEVAGRVVDDHRRVDRPRRMPGCWFHRRRCPRCWLYRCCYWWCGWSVTRLALPAAAFVAASTLRRSGRRRRFGTGLLARSRRLVRGDLGCLGTFAHAVSLSLTKDAPDHTLTVRPSDHWQVCGADIADNPIDGTELLAGHLAGGLVKPPWSPSAAT